MRKMINTYHVEGQLYDQNLEVRTTGSTSKNPGTEYIRGDISIATDSKHTNIIRVYYTYVAANSAGGRTWNALQEILNGTRKTYMKSGDEAAFVRIDTNIAVNDFPSRNGEIVSQTRNEGGFIHFIEPSGMSAVSKENPFARNKFTVDAVITQCVHVDENEETKSPEHLALKAAIFSFRNELVPIELTVVDPKAIEYFESQDISAVNPFCTQVWGPEEAITTVYTETKESAWGDAEVIERTRSIRSFTVAKAIPDPYEWNSEEFITAEEFAAAIQARNVHLAEVKERGTHSTAAPATAPQKQVANAAAGGFDF